MPLFRTALIVLLTGLFLPPTYAADNDHWDTQFGAPGADGSVFRIVASGSDVYMTGSFTSAGEAGCVGIAKWDGVNWTGFGSGFAVGPNPFGFALAVRGPEVYVGGYFITNISGVPVRNLGKWNGSSWSQVGDGINGIVYDLLFRQNDLYVSGIFNGASGVVATNIVRWDGTNWYPLGAGVSGSTNGSPVVKTMVLDSNGDLIVGGNFRYADGVEVNNIARWDGSQWHDLGGGLYNGGSGLVVNSLAVLGPDIYAVGVFKSAGGVNATNVARWDGTQWHSMNAGASGSYNAITVVGTTIYTAGSFTNINGVAARYVARWNGSAWEALAPGLAGGTLTSISCLGSDGVNLYAGGDFIQAGNASALAVAKWDGNEWSALTGPKSQGTWLSAISLAAVGNELYAGGSGLLIAGGLRPNAIAHWNGSGWDNVGGGVTGGSGRVNSILEYGGNIYVGGDFTNAGGIAARNIAYWDGFNWHALASGLNSNVNALVVHNGELYAGGGFSTRGNGSGGPMFGMARWNGSDWQSLGISAGRTDNAVNALASDGANLYAGGNFLFGWLTDSTTNIARWNGVSWNKLGVGIRPTVSVLAIMGGELYAGGSFTNASGVTARRIAKWNGSAWSEVGGGMNNGTVSALGVINSSLYVGGSFTNAGGIPGINKIARWDGSQWHALGSGVARLTTAQPSVSDIATSGNDVYLVGTFTYAGGRPSAAIAHWNETVSFVPPVIRLLNPGINGLGQFHFEVDGLSSGTFTVEASTNLTTWSDIHSDSVPNTNVTDTASPTIPARVYRVKTP
jgi:hypothetical protein